MSIAPARPASTVVLLRPASASANASAGKSPIEVLLVRRSDSVAFMGGAHVFPGGRVDAADHLDASAAIADGVDAIAARMSDVPVGDAAAHHVAAVRELFEEAGVL